MAKQQLLEAQRAYDRCISQARNAEAAGQYYDAVQSAMAAWDHVADMMKYERQYEEAEHKSLPCVDIVLKYAPYLLDADSLNRMAELLKGQRSIERNTSDDFAARLQAARDILKAVHRLYDRMERDSLVPVRSIVKILGGNQGTWGSICKRLESMEIVHPIEDAGARFVALATNLQKRVRAKCPACGAAVRGSKRGCLSEQECPGCKSQVVYVMIEEIPLSAEEIRLCGSSSHS